MDSSRTPLDPDDAERRFAELLAEAGLPRFASAHHDAAADELEFAWENGLVICMDLTDEEVSPIEDWEREAILGIPPWDRAPEPIHITVPGSPGDPREDTSLPGVVIHRVPALHPDDVTMHRGIPVTSPSRTLIDLAEMSTEAELRAAFARARDMGLLDPEALRAARARVEWRPSLAMLDAVIEEFCG